mmetsp:Transcript_79347/g.137581  ORF Transcript_79347/g.137581 Transcript_79347/m.137581 type:complete len:208 (-) Transcript_79347:139-762(-)
MEWKRYNSAIGLPELVYPVPVVVRNTFIDAPLLQKSESLEEFLKVRKAVSCPAVSPHVEPQEDVKRAETAQELCRASTPLAEGIQAVASWLRPEGSSSGSDEECDANQACRSADARSWPSAASVQVPTIGSAEHHLGRCKPCAFFHTRGCASGADCLFCHLCDADAKKLRKKQKLVERKKARLLRQQRNAARTAPFGSWFQNFPSCV